MEAITKLTEINYAYIFVSVITVLVGLKGLATVIEWFIKKLGIEFKWMRKKREEHELLLQTSKSLNLLIEKEEHDIKKIYEDNLKYRDQSREIREDLKNDIEKISEKLDKMTEKNNKRIRAELKDRIGQSYRYYHQNGKINDMELNALEDLIKEYESANGDNSFVHSVVQKEMYTWEKVNRE